MEVCREIDGDREWQIEGIEAVADDRFKPPKRYKATPASLAFAKRVAKALGLPFDPDQVGQLADDLYEVMFADLVRVLEIDPGSVDFASGRYHRAQAFAAPNWSGQPVVVLDMVFEAWLSGLALLNTVLAVGAPNQTERQRILETANTHFEMITDSQRFERAREELAPFYLRYEEFLNLSEGLGRSMLVFVLCHELAHVHLGHLEQEPSREQELEADRLGSELFHRVVEAGKLDSETHIHVDPKVACAPIALTQILDLHETWLTLRGREPSGSSKHPTAEERLVVVKGVIEPTLTDMGAYVLNALTLGLADLRGDFCEAYRKQP